MSLEFTEKNLNEIYTITSGLSKSSDEFGFGFPFLSFKTIFYNYYIISDLDELVNSTEEEQKKHSVKKGDVFLTRTSETLDELGMSCVALKDYPHATFNGFTKRLRPKKDNVIHPLYACYYFRSPLFRKYVDSMAIMTTRASLNNNILSKLPIIFPSYENQKKIGYLLYSLDKKIELNKEINKNLEQLMKYIFEDWFVNFNYSTNNISFKPSELGEIPSNWNVKTLADVLTILESGKRPKGGISEINDGIPSIGAENILGLGKFNYSKNKLISHDFFNKLKKGVIQDQDVLLYKDGAQLGRKSLFMNGFPFDICCINEHVFRLQSNNEISQFYLYLWLDQEIMTNEIINLNSNSVQPGINQNDVKSLPILIPELQIMNKFTNIVSPMMNKIFDNALEIKKLNNLRDTLLPKLMSGEIDISKINCDLE